MTRLRVFAARNGFTLIKIDKLTITAEQHKGKSATSKKFLLPKAKEAKEFETKVLAALKKEFHII